MRRAGLGEDLLQLLRAGVVQGGDSMNHGPELTQKTEHPGEFTRVGDAEIHRHLIKAQVLRVAKGIQEEFPRPRSDARNCPLVSSQQRLDTVELGIRLSYLLVGEARLLARLASKPTEAAANHESLDVNKREQEQQKSLALRLRRQNKWVSFVIHQNWRSVHQPQQTASLVR